MRGAGWGQGSNRAGMCTQLGTSFSRNIRELCIIPAPQSYPTHRAVAKIAAQCSPCPSLAVLCQGGDGGNLPGEAAGGMLALNCNGHWGRGTNNIHCAHGSQTWLALELSAGLLGTQNAGPQPQRFWSGGLGWHDSLHFQQVPRWCWWCWSRHHSLRITALHLPFPSPPSTLSPGWKRPHRHLVHPAPGRLHHTTLAASYDGLSPLLAGNY